MPIFKFSAYVFINAKGKRRAEILASLRYQPKPYPHNDERA